MSIGFTFTGKYAVYNVVKGEIVTSLDRDLLVLFNTKEEAESVGKAMFDEGGYEIVEFVA